MKIKSKLINHLIINGKKETAEKLCSKNFKKLQKKSLKCSSKLFQLALTSSISLFRLHRISLRNRKKNKVREIPGFLQSQNSRISLSLKSILKTIYTKQKTQATKTNFSESFSTTILSNSKGEGDNLVTKSENQKALVAKKYLFRYYRWR